MVCLTAFPWWFFLIFTSLLDFFAYSVRCMAENIPMGTAMSSDRAVIYTVLTMAGIMDILSVLNSHSKSSGFILGIPFMSMYPMRRTVLPR